MLLNEDWYLSVYHTSLTHVCQYHIDVVYKKKNRANSQQSNGLCRSALVYVKQQHRRGTFAEKRTR